MLPQLILSLLFTAVVNARDPSTPCISGTCAHQTGDGSSMAYSLLTINTESDTSLSDITGAAGWDIIECDPSSVETQDIRLVCVDKSKGCDHLFKGGEEHTIVRLPDSCAGGPFARVVRSWISDDQTIPARLRTRHIDAPVRALTLDFDFSKIPESNGKVYITASATNSQVQRDAMTRFVAKGPLISTRHATRTSKTRAIIREFVMASEKRSPTMKTRGRNQVGDALQDSATGAAHAIPSEVQEATGVVYNGVNQSGNSTGKAVDTASGAAQNSTGNTVPFNETTVHFDIHQSFPVLTTSLTCPSKGSTPGYSVSVSVTAAVRANLDLEYGFIFTGSIVPAKIDELAFTSTMTGKVAAVFDIKANVKGTFDTGLIPLLQAGVPGLDFPGILTVGPSMSLNAEAVAFLGVTADLKVSSTFDLPQISMVYPPNQGPSAARVTPEKTPIRVDVGTSAELEGRAEVHLIPRLDMGVKILKGAETTVFLELDTSAGVDFKLSAARNATVSGTEDHPVVSLDDVGTKFGGSLNADEGVSINAGATAALSPFFNETVSITLFSKTFPLFKKIIGNPATRRSVLLERAETSGLICPGGTAEININQPILDVPAATPQE